MSDTPLHEELRRLTPTTFEQFFARTMNAIADVEAGPGDWATYERGGAKAIALATLTAGMIVAQALDRLADRLNLVAQEAAARVINRNLPHGPRTR